MPTDTLDSTFAALADPTRRAILARLSSGEATVTELAEPFEMTLPAVSKHLRVLERAGLVSRGRVAQSRPCRLEWPPSTERSYRPGCQAPGGNAQTHCGRFARLGPSRESPTSGPRFHTRVQAIV